jgi:hypothetical protein
MTTLAQTVEIHDQRRSALVRGIPIAKLIHCEHRGR